MTQDSLFPMPQETRTSDDYWTPKWLFDVMDIEFDLDVACPPEGPFHTPAKAWYTQETDGLMSPWNGRVWMNPPFSKITPWVDRFIAHKNGVCLLPFSKSMWFNRLWNEDCGIVAIPRNKAAFVQGDIFLPCFVAAFNEECVEAIARIGKLR